MRFLENSTNLPHYICDQDVETSMEEPGTKDEDVENRDTKTPLIDTILKPNHRWLTIIAD